MSDEKMSSDSSTVMVTQSIGTMGKGGRDRSA